METTHTVQYSTVQYSNSIFVYVQLFSRKLRSYAQQPVCAKTACQSARLWSTELLKHSNQISRNGYNVRRGVPPLSLGENKNERG